MPLFVLTTVPAGDEQLSPTFADMTFTLFPFIKKYADGHGVNALIWQSISAAVLLKSISPISFFIIGA